MKKIIFLIIISFLLYGCSKEIKVPDVKGVNITTAESILTENGLIPIIESEYSIAYEIDKVIRTYPVTSSQVEENTQIKVYVSKGPAIINSKDSILSWFNVVGSTSDTWEFYAPRVNKGILEVELKPYIKSSYKITWLEYGEASLLNDYSSSVPFDFVYSDITGFYTLKLNSEKLGNITPNKVFLKLNYKYGEKQDYLNLELTINW